MFQISLLKWINMFKRVFTNNNVLLPFKSGHEVNGNLKPKFSFNRVMYVKMGVETCVTLWYLPKQKNISYIYFNLLLAFLQPSLAPKIFFSTMSWSLKIDLLTCISTLYLFANAFLYGGGAWDAPPSIHRFRPFSLYWVKLETSVLHFKLYIVSV